ncbi:MAG: tRNA (adenosine(37)-N6)-threonylcarbamoyltransferase complex ATPase subunit type 1 TsaE [Candidatus Aminicenantales bacterium]
MKQSPEPAFFITRSAEETEAVARKIASGWTGTEVVLLQGELGAGKTVFARGLAAGLGVKNLGEVCSPSFTIINIYQGKWPIYHIDLYRLDREEDILDLGWEDYLGKGVIIVEWGEKIKFGFGQSIYYVQIEIDSQDIRRISVTIRNLD